MLGKELVIDSSPTCNYQCISGYTECTSDSCADLTSDPLNCGSCGHRCGSGESCNSGRCVADSVTCSSLDCPKCCCNNTDGSKYCSDSSIGNDGLACRCKDDPIIQCKPNCEYLYNGVCYSNTNEHCGSYYHSCASDEVCNNGTCKPKPTGGSQYFNECILDEPIEP